MTWSKQVNNKKTALSDDTDIQVTFNVHVTGKLIASLHVRYDHGEPEDAIMAIDPVTGVVVDFNDESKTEIVKLQPKMTPLALLRAVRDAGMKLLGNTEE